MMRENNSLTLFNDFDFSMTFSPFISEPVDQERSRAKKGQITHIGDLNKNVLYIVLAYMKPNEIFSLLKSSKKINEKIKHDPFFH